MIKVFGLYNIRLLAGRLFNYSHFSVTNCCLYNMISSGYQQYAGCVTGMIYNMLFKINRFSGFVSDTKMSDYSTIETSGGPIAGKRLLSAMRINQGSGFKIKP